jgi:hypothetical protein
MENVREEGKLELTEALRSYAGGAANWAPHRAERGPYTGRGASTVGLFAVTGPAYERSRMNSRRLPLG